MTLKESSMKPQRDRLFIPTVSVPGKKIYIYIKTNTKHPDLAALNKLKK